MENGYRFQIGEFQCLAVNDGNFVSSAETVFFNAPEEKRLQLLREYGFDPEALSFTCTCLLVKTAGNVVLVDTGVGAGAAFGGRLLPVLRAEGFRPEDVDTVILTHGDGDHIGGSVDAAGEVTFPEARHYLWQDEWDFWTAEANVETDSERAAGMARQTLSTLAPHLETIGTMTEIVPGIRVIAAPGHSSGQMAVEVESGGECLLYIADVALHPIHVEHPEWYSRMDQSPEQTVATRQAIYRHAADKNALVLAFHFPPFPSMGHIVQQGDGWTWRPIEAMA